MTKRILLLTTNPIGSDPRFKRHLRALGASGDFELITSSPGPPLEASVPHIELGPGTLFQPKTATGLATLAGRRYDLFLQRAPVREAVRAALLPDADFDAVLCSGLELVPVSVEIARGRDVFVDLREYYPEQLPESRRWRLLIRPLMHHILESYADRWAGSITVSPGLVDLYEKTYGFRPELVTNAAVGRHPELRKTADPVRLVSSGTSNPNRGLEVAIAAAANLPSIEFDLVLLSLPHHLRYRAKLEELAGQTSNVRVLPPVPAGDLPALHDSYDVGMCTFPAHSPQLNYGLPNKMFDYVQSGLAIAAGPGVHMAGLVEEYGMGPVVERFDEQSIRDVLMQLSPRRVDEWKSNTCAAAELLDAEPSAERLRNLLRRRSQSG